jgi:hypothetical protein
MAIHLEPWNDLRKPKQKCSQGSVSNAQVFTRSMGIMRKGPFYISEDVLGLKEDFNTIWKLEYSCGQRDCSDGIYTDQCVTSSYDP